MPWRRRPPQRIGHAELVTLLHLADAFGGLTRRYQVHGVGMPGIFWQAGFGELDRMGTASGEHTVNQGSSVFRGWHEICRCWRLEYQA